MFSPHLFNKNTRIIYFVFLLLFGKCGITHEIEIFRNSSRFGFADHLRFVHQSFKRNGWYASQSCGEDIHQCVKPGIDVHSAVLVGSLRNTV